MSTPALLPALAILVGVLAGALGPDLSARWPALACAALALAAVACAWLRWGRGRGAGSGFDNTRLEAAWHGAGWLGALVVLLAALAFLGGGVAVTLSARHAARSPSICTALGRGPPAERPCGRVPPDPVVLEGTLTADAALLPKNVALELDAARAWIGGHPVEADGGVQVRVLGGLAAAAVQDWCAGRRVRLTASLREPGVFRDPGVPDARETLARKGTALIGTVKSAALVEVVARGDWVSEQAARVRQLTRRAVKAYVARWSDRSASIVVAILIGDRAGLEPEVQLRLQQAGTYHVIAISGGNIAILTGVLLVGVRALRLGQRWGSLLAILVLLSYAVIVGGGASVVRATVMAALYFAGRLVDQRGSGLNGVAVAAAGILTVTPYALFDASFLLTFGATIGIILGAGVAAGWMKGPVWWRATMALFVASLSAEVALLPVAARVFSRVTFAGLLVNFAAIPLMSLGQIAGMALVPLSQVAPPLAVAAGYLAHVGAEGLVESAKVVEWLPWLTYRLPPPSTLVCVLYYVGLGTWLWQWARTRGVAMPRGGTRRRRATRCAAAALTCLSAVWILVEPVTLLRPGVSGRLRVTTLDVGHADAILVQLPDRRSLLVDAGGSITSSTFDIGRRVVGPALWALGTRRLDALVVSHPDPDHIGGALAVMDDFRPRAIWDGIPVPGLPARDALEQAAARRGIPWFYKRAGEVVRMGDVEIRVWHPPPPDWERRRTRNDDSLVLELRYGRVSVVLPGDAGEAVERRLPPIEEPDRRCLLKVPHHGSATSSSAEFLGRLRPMVAFLSAGALTKVNAGVLDRYRALGTTVFRTDVDGAITIDIEGSRVDVRTFTGRRWSEGEQAAATVRRP